jgi:hypothetical protein
MGQKRVHDDKKREELAAIREDRGLSEKQAISEWANRFLRQIMVEREDDPAWRPQGM